MRFNGLACALSAAGRASINLRNKAASGVAPSPVTLALALAHDGDSGTEGAGVDCALPADLAAGVPALPEAARARGNGTLAKSW